MAVDISTLTNDTDFLTPYQVKKIVYDYKTNVKPPTYPSGVAVNLSKGDVTEGEIVYATAQIVPSGYDSKRIRSITWEASSNVNINPQSGIITARSAGTAAVRCTVTYHPVSMDDNETRTVSGTTYLIVQPATVYADYVVATLDNYSVTQGDTLYARATVYPTNASNRSVTWRSSNPSIASIDSISGKITTYAAGSVYFIATAADGSGRTANTSNLQIAAKEVKVSNISVTVDPSTVTAGGTAQASATVYPSNANNRAVTWSISPTSGASITQSGAITTTAQGNYTVTATAQDGSGEIGSDVLTVNELQKIDADLIANWGNKIPVYVEETFGIKCIDGHVYAMCIPYTSGGFYNGYSYILRGTDMARDNNGKMAYVYNQLLRVGNNGNVLNVFDDSNNPIYNMKSIAFGANKFVAVGSNGRIAYFVWDGKATIVSGITGNTLNSVCFANNMFIAVGNGGVILKSTNGQTWSAVNSDVAYGANLKKVIYANSKWVIIGESGTLLTSSNGTTFTRIENYTDRPKQITDIAGGSNYFVYITESGTIYSTKDFVTYKPVATTYYVAYKNARHVTHCTGAFYIQSNMYGYETTVTNLSNFL